jgi:hypothetical protein
MRRFTLSLVRISWPDTSIIANAYRQRLHQPDGSLSSKRSIPAATRLCYTIDFYYTDVPCRDINRQYGIPAFNGCAASWLQYGIHDALRYTHIPGIDQHHAQATVLPEQAA